MTRWMLMLGAAALTAGCGDPGAKAKNTQLDLALSGVDRVERNLTTPDGALQTLWALQDARSIAHCETARLRLSLPQSREAKIIAAASGRDLPWDNLYTGGVKTDLRVLAGDGADNCATIPARVERRIMDKQTDATTGAVQFFVTMRNVLADPTAEAALSDKDKLTRSRGVYYRYSFTKADGGWLLSELAVKPWGTFTYQPVSLAASPLMDTPGL